MKIIRAQIEAIEEPIGSAFAFKGKYSARPMWNTAVKLTGATGETATGLSNQGILWSDGAVFNGFSHTGGNSVMYLMSDYACHLAERTEFETPQELLGYLLPRVWEYGKKVSGLSHLRETFALNSLVALDTAAWLLYAREHGIASFDALIPENAKPGLECRNDKLAAIPLITYSASLDDIKRETDAGCFFLKIKLGSDPDHDGDQEKMLEWDKKRLSAIHNLLKDTPCPYTENGHIPYYLDANGRYETTNRLFRLIDHMDKIGMLERVALLEEPLPENLEADISSIPVRVAADETAHSDADVRKRIDMGYRAIALKPIAKTMSMTFDMIAVCAQRHIPCFCADLTVNAAMVDINKNFAARLNPLPGLKVGLCESNGHQYYTNWERMIRTLPEPDAAWVIPRKGLYILDDSFYKKSGGIFERNMFYEGMFS